MPDDCHPPWLEYRPKGEVELETLKPITRHTGHRPRADRADAIAGGALARVQTIGTNTHVSADENGYVGNANRMLGGERYATFKWPPGTSFAFAVSTRLSGHHSLRLSTHAKGPAQYMQLVIGVLALMLVAALTWLLAGPWAAVIATALSPPTSR